MRPSAAELLVRVAATLRTEIAPLLADQPWPASELRSIDAVLAHLAARVEHEVAVLSADNDDLRELLARLEAAGVPGVSEVAARGRRDGSTVDAPLGPAALEAANLVYRTALEQAIHQLHAADRRDEIGDVRAYLVRSAGRERQIYGPFLAQPMF